MRNEEFSRSHAISFQVSFRRLLVERIVLCTDSIALSSWIMHVHSLEQYLRST